MFARQDGHAELAIGTPTKRASPWRQRAQPSPPVPPGAAVHKATGKLNISPVRARGEELNMSQQTMELLFKQQNEIEGSIEARLCAAVDALRSEIREMDARMERQAVELRRNGGLPNQVEQAVASALSLYADNGAAALVCLAEELDRPANAPPLASPHNPICRTLRSSLGTFIGDIVTRQIANLWDDPVAAVPMSVRKHVQESARGFQDSLGLVSDDIRAVVESHPLAPRVAALEVQVTTNKGLPHQPAPASQDIEQLSGKVADMAQKVQGILADTSADEAMKQHHEEVWKHINTTEAMLEKIVTDMKEDLDAVKEELKAQQQKHAEDRQRDKEQAAKDRQRLEDEIEELKQGHQGGPKAGDLHRSQEKMRDELRALRNDVAQQMTEVSSSSLRTVNEALKRTRDELIENLSDLRREGVTRPEMVNERRRVNEALDRLQEAIEEAESRATGAALSTLESSRATTAARLQQLEDDSQQLQGLASDVKYMKANQDASTSELTAKVANLESNDRRKDADRAVKKLEARLREVDERMAKTVPVEQLEARDREWKRDISELESRLQQQSASGAKLKSSQLELQGLSTDVTNLKRNRDEHRALIDTILASKADKEETEAVQVEVQNVKRQVEPEIKDIKLRLQSLAENQFTREESEALEKALGLQVKDAVDSIRGVIPEATAGEVTAFQSSLNDMDSRLQAMEDTGKQTTRTLAEIDEHLQIGLPALAVRLEEQEEAGRALADQLTDINDTHSGLRDNLSQCNQGIAKLDGYVRQLAGDRDASVEEMQAKLQDIAARQEIETQQLRRLVEKAGIALENFASQPGTPKMQSIDSSGGGGGPVTDSFKFPRNSSFYSNANTKQHVAANVLREQLSKPLEGRRSGTSTPNPHPRPPVSPLIDIGSDGFNY